MLLTPVFSHDRHKIMTRAEFITENRKTKTVLVYRHPDMFRVTAKSSHIIEGNTMTFKKQTFDLTGWTVAIKS